MSAPKLFLFGPPRVERDGTLISVERRNVRALLAYLAVSAQPHSRDTLAALLWPDADQSQARGALRRDLSVLHRLLGAEHVWMHEQTVSLRLDAGLWVDVAEFRRLLAQCEQHAHPVSEVCAACLTSLSEAASLYRDDFLAGFSLRNSPDFDDWQLLQSEQLRREQAHALERLTHAHGVRSDYEPALAYARRWLLLDPLHEPAHRQLMRLYAAAGQRAAALHQYDVCVRVLERELGGPPEPETIRVRDSIKAQHALPVSTEAMTLQPSRAHPPQASARRARTGAGVPLTHIVHAGLVGRERELAQAYAHWEQALSGHGLMLAVSGEPGIGKTRLLRELIDSARGSGARVLVGECYAESGAPFAPFAQIIRESLGYARESGALPAAVLADLLTLVPSLRTLYPALAPNPTLEPKWAQERIFESVAALLDVVAVQSPLLLCVEDAHWADSSTLALLLQLARKARARRWLLVVSYRGSELDANQALDALLRDVNRECLGEWLVLKGLEREQTRDLLAALLATAGNISADFLDGVYAETEGNPFFVEEVCKALIADGKLYYSDGQWLRAPMRDIGLPQSVRAAILSRVEKLPALVQETLHAAAVLGREFEFALLQTLTATDEAALSAALEHGVRAQLIAETPSAGNLTFTFAHALIPFALRESLSGLRLQRLHRRAVADLERLRPADVEALAYHSLAAGERDKAVAYARQAAERALVLYAYEAAAQQLRSALLLLEADRDREARTAVLARLADVSELTGAQLL